MTLAFMLLSVCGLFLAMLLLVETGHRIGLSRRTRRPNRPAGIRGVDAAVFGLMGLLLAFTYAGAASRLDARRQYIVEESNAIGTAYLRLDLLPPETQSQLRQDFRAYVESRLAAYQKLPDFEAMQPELGRSKDLLRKIWNQAVAGGKQADSPAAPMLVLSSLNTMIDITNTRTVAIQLHQPVLVFVMLAIMVLASSLLAGYSMSASDTRSWLHVVSFAALVTAAVYVIFELEYPRIGLIRVDAVDRALAELLRSMQ